MYRRIESLRPEFQPIAREWEARCKADGLGGCTVRIDETFRTTARQHEVDQQKASSVKFGWHNVGQAFDYSAFDRNGNYIRNGSHPAYTRACEIARELGCKSPIHLANGNLDSGHVEWHPHYTLVQLLENIKLGHVAEWNPPEES